jgi:hypothetical protein
MPPECATDYTSTWAPSPIGYLLQVGYRYSSSDSPVAVYSSYPQNTGPAFDKEFTKLMAE